jgi:hypothetical protein
MPKPTYKPFWKPGTPEGIKVEEVGYSPLMVVAGSTTHRLALHKSSTGIWMVADPKSGAVIIRAVQGQFAGLRLDRSTMTLKEVRQLALADVELLISRIGSERFNATLANPKPF